MLALVPVLGWVALLAAGGLVPEFRSPSTLIALGIASVFELFGAAVLGRSLRRTGPAPERPTTGRYLLGVAAGAIVTAALVTPALAAAQLPAYEGAGIELPTHHGG